MDDDLIANFAPALVWNRLAGPALWFHYTSRDAARAIVRTRTFNVGTRHAAGRAGIYVCPHVPGAKSEDELAGLILDGTFHERERLQAVVVLAPGPDVAFTSDPDTPLGMRYLADPGRHVPLRNQIVGWAAKFDGEWRHSRTLFDPDALRLLTSGRQP
jgi:hypothetical protein